MNEYNKDIYIPDADKLQYKSIKPIVENQLAISSFEKFEASAKKYKILYRFWGRVSVWMILIATLYSTFWISFDVGEILAVSYAAIIFSIAALVIIGVIWQRGWKRRWLNSRYAAERTRSIFYQAAHLANSASNADELNAEVRKFTSNAIGALNAELALPHGAMKNFLPKSALEISSSVEDNPVSSELNKSARGFYRRWRLGYQATFARNEAEKLRVQNRPHQAIADYIFISAAILVAISLTMKLFTTDQLIYAGISFERFTEFLGLALFIVSACFAVLENASLTDENVHRYENYENDLNLVKSKIDSVGAGLIAEIRETELLALRELQEFTDQAQRMSYRL